MQELTNKLQRYLNQRFMLDSDQVNYGDDDRSDEDTCNGCRNGLGFCDGTLTCLDKKCKGRCMNYLSLKT